MKAKHDPRHQNRRDIVQQLFAESFTMQPQHDDETKEILAMTPHLDSIIQAAAPTWPIDKINKIDLAILRLAVYELEKEQTPPKVIIDEAVELAKEFGAESSPPFVNGVLATVFAEEEKETTDESKQNE
jgi:transcription antitermination protein NusB